MIVAIQQPEHLPWIGFFNKMAQCEKYVLLDHVQFKKNYFENRNRIKTASGAVYITVPIRLKGRFGQTMLETEVAVDQNWKRKYLLTIEQSYVKTPFFGTIKQLIWPVIDSDCSNIVDINIGLIFAIKEYLSLDAEIVRSSTMNVGGAKKDGLVLEICKVINADVYISGPDGRNYLDLADFGQAGIKVLFHDFIHPVYPQKYGEFSSHLSVIDLIANCGPESQAIVRECYKITV